MVQKLTTRFVRKSFEIDAAQVTEQNIEEVAEWCDGEIQTNRQGVKYIRVNVVRPVTERQGMAYIGDHVMWDGRGFKVYNNQAFWKAFERKVAAAA